MEDLPPPSSEDSTAENGPLELAPEEKPRARKRSVNVCALDDETLQKLNEDFARYDEANTGILAHDQVKKLMTESYCPTEAEVDNVLKCLKRDEEASLSFDEYIFGFHTSFRERGGHPQQSDPEWMADQFSLDLHHFAKHGKSNLQEREYSEAAIAEAKSELGAEWVDLLQKRFQSSTEEVGAMQLSKDDMFKLIKAAFTPSEEKIDQVMQFFAMTGDGGVNQMNFLSGMTLLYGDLGHLAASPVKS